MKPWSEFRKYVSVCGDSFWGCVYSPEGKAQWYDSAERLETALYLSYINMGLTTLAIEELEDRPIEEQLAFLAQANRDVVHGSILKLRYERGELE